MPSRAKSPKRSTIGFAAAYYIVFIATCACSSAPDTQTHSSAPELVRIELEAQNVQGISGLTRTSDGSLLAVAERNHKLLILSAKDGRTLSLGKIAGIDPWIEFESIAWLGDSRIALGTELSADGREYDTIYIAEVVASDARVENQIVLKYELWGISSHGNHGIEGLCADGTTMLAGLETTIERNGKRLAPIGRYDMSRETWTPLWLQLTSESGKLSALDCRERGDHLDVIAIERHFEVTRVLRFSVPYAGEVGVIVPVIAINLLPYKLEKDNFEGVVWLDERSAVLILDNHYGSITGPNTLLRVSF